MIYRNSKTGLFHVRIKGEAEAMFNKRSEAEQYQREFNNWENEKLKEAI